MKLQPFLAAATATLLGGTSVAVMAGDPHGRLDADGDGYVSYTEMKTGRPGLTADEFNAMDTNGDGNLEHSELRKARRAKAGEHRSERREAAFAEMDTDASGGVSAEEFAVAQASRTAKVFSKLDKNSDGELSPDEVRKPHRDRHHRKHRRDDVDEQQ